MDSDGGGWTLFYAGPNAYPRTKFTDLGSSLAATCPHPQFDCVRKIPADRLAADTTFAASCGSAMLKFAADAVAVQLFRDGTTPGGSQYYQPISGVAQVYGTTSPLPDTLYCGTQAQGWFLIQNLAPATNKVFASGYPGYDGCNNVDDRAGPVASLYWREN